MPPTPRPIPSFIADSTQEGIPHGRFVERLAEPFRKACTEIEELPDGVEPPDKLVWFPERAWGGRTWVPCTARADGPEGELELFGHVSYARPEEGEPTDFRASADFTDVIAEDNPDWKIDLNDDVIGSGSARTAAPATSPSSGAARSSPTRSPPPPSSTVETVDQEAVSNDRFTIIALDALKGYGDDLFMQIKLWSRRAQELASESLYD